MNISPIKSKEPHLLSLILISSFASMGAVIFAPGLPQIADYFHISHSKSQLTITLFLMGYALGQLIYGPLANRFGRKPAFYIGLAMATLGSLVSIASEPLHSFAALIIGRLLEAVGSSAGLIVAFTMIADYYPALEARRIMAYLMLAFAIVPGISTALGGVLVTYFPWVSCFYFLLIYGLLLIIPAVRLQETAKVLKKDALHFRVIFRNYYDALRNNLLVHVTLFIALSAVCVYLYIATAPFIAIHHLKFSPSTYGFVGLIPFIGTGLGSLLSVRLAHSVSVATLMKAGLLLDIVAVLLLSSVFYFDIINLPLLILCGFILMFGNCLLIGNGVSVATSTSSDKANASAVMNFILIGMPALSTFIVSITPGSHLVKLPSAFVAAMVLMCIVWIFVVSKKWKEQAI